MVPFPVQTFCFAWLPEQLPGRLLFVNQHIPSLFHTDFAARLFGFAVCGRNLASVSRFVAKIGHAGRNLAYPVSCPGSGARASKSGHYASGSAACDCLPWRAAPWPSAKAIPARDGRLLACIGPAGPQAGIDPLGGFA